MNPAAPSPSDSSIAQAFRSVPPVYQYEHLWIYDAEDNLPPEWRLCWSFENPLTDDGWPADRIRDVKLLYCDGTGIMSSDNHDESECTHCVAPAAAVGGEQERDWRLGWACSYSGANLYSDDGELQDNSVSPFIDWLHDSAADIGRKIEERARKKATPAAPVGGFMVDATYPDATGWAGPGHGKLGEPSSCCGTRVTGATLYAKDGVDRFRRLHCSNCDSGSWGLHYPQEVMDDTVLLKMSIGVSDPVERACIEFHGDLGWNGTREQDKQSLRERMKRALKAASPAAQPSAKDGVRDIPMGGQNFTHNEKKILDAINTHEFAKKAVAESFSGLTPREATTAAGLMDGDDGSFSYAFDMSGKWMEIMSERLRRDNAAKGLIVDPVDGEKAAIGREVGK